MEWISVFDRNPEDQEEVLAWSGTKQDYFIATYWAEADTFANEDCQMIRDVTHWFPIHPPGSVDAGES